VEPRGEGVAFLDAVTHDLHRGSTQVQPLLEKLLPISNILVLSCVLQQSIFDAQVTFPARKKAQKVDSN
jgi:hypothetical protein